MLVRGRGSGQVDSTLEFLEVGGVDVMEEIAPRIGGRFVVLGIAPGVGDVGMTEVLVSAMGRIEVADVVVPGMHDMAVADNEAEFGGTGNGGMAAYYDSRVVDIDFEPQ